MDETPLEEYLDVLQNLTTALDSEARELQSVAAFLKGLRITLNTDQFNDMQKFLLDAINDGHEVHQKVLSATIYLSKIIDKQQRPPDKPKPPQL